MFIYVSGTPDAVFDDVYKVREPNGYRNGRLTWLKVHPLDDPNPKEIFWYQPSFGHSVWVIAGEEGYMFPKGEYDLNIPPEFATWMFYEPARLTHTNEVPVTISCSHTSAPTTSPTSAPSTSPTTGPTFTPTVDPTSFPTTSPSTEPSSSPTSEPTPEPTLPDWFVKGGTTEAPSEFPTRDYSSDNDGTFTGWSVEDLANNDVMFTPWTTWTICDKTCGNGYQWRMRSCTNGIPSDCVIYFGEPYTEVRACSIQDCSAWFEWQEWTECTNSCAGGFQSRSRSCSYGAPDACTARFGQAWAEIADCQTQDCPAWNEWDEWEDCPATCGGATQYRFRTCPLAIEDPTVCYMSWGEVGGLNYESQSCNTRDCPQWMSWLEWGPCTVTCDVGYRMRERICPLDVEDPLVCVEAWGEIHWESEPCNTMTCSSLTISPTYSPTDEPTDEPTHSPSVIPSAPPSKSPTESPTDSPTDSPTMLVNWNEWGGWADCTASCDGGSKIRDRQCYSPEDEFISQYTVDGLTEELLQWCELHTGESAVEITACNEDPCPMWYPWEEWSNCTRTCGTGVTTRIRGCQLDDLQGCFDIGGASYEAAQCNTQFCPQWSVWQEWGACSATCSGQDIVGQRQRTRGCEGNMINDCLLLGGGESYENGLCNTEPCPTYDNWQDWSGCDVTCGTGQRSRIRTCTTS